MSYARESLNPRLRLPVPEGVGDEALVARERGLVLCKCRARYSVKKDYCPECGASNPWKGLKPAPQKTPPGLSVLLAP